MGKANEANKKHNKTNMFKLLWLRIKQQQNTWEKQTHTQKQTDFQTSLAQNQKAKNTWENQQTTKETNIQSN